MAENVKPNERTVFGVGNTPEGGIALIIGIPFEAWERMKSAPIDKFGHIDLSSIGVPLKVMMFACPDRASGIKVIEDYNASQGAATLRSSKDFGIKGVT